jgi:Ppx/GppA phosphatase family
MRELLALLDFGSNAARFVLASVTPGRGFRVLREDRVQTRLAAGRGRQLPARSIEATVQATRRFLRRADTGRPIRVVAVATGAVRDADNAHRLAAAIRAVAGVDIEVLDWKEEAALGAAAAMTSLPARDALVVDVGGAACRRRGFITARSRRWRARRSAPSAPRVCYATIRRRRGRSSRSDVRWGRRWAPPPRGWLVTPRSSRSAALPARSAGSISPLGARRAACTVCDSSATSSPRSAAGFKICRSGGAAGSQVCAETAPTSSWPARWCSTSS